MGARALAQLSAVDPWAASTQALCSDEACSVAVLNGLKMVQHNKWGLKEKHMKDLLGNGTPFTKNNVPDVCLAAMGGDLPSYLTTTTTPPPTTTTTTPTPPPPKAGAAEVVVAASYAAVETLPADVT